MRVLRIVFIAVLLVRALSGGATCALGADDKPAIDPAGSGRKDAGHVPAAEIEPPPQWVNR